MSSMRWGCPWHGLIRDGKIHTHTGRTVAYQQPPTGDTHLIDFGMPEIDTPQSDAIAGMEWRNTAIMQGRFLCGVQLPVGGWIYRDPAGKNWLVETVGFGGGDGWGPYVDGQAFKLKLSRFGVFGGAPESHFITLATPPINQDASAAGISAGSARYDLECVTPRGDRAVYVILRSRDELISFIEFTLSGPGESCSASVKIVRTAAQTRPARVVTGDKFGTLGTLFYRSSAILGEPLEEYGPASGACASTWRSSTWDLSLKSTPEDNVPVGPVWPVRAGNIFEWDTQYSEVEPDRILALFYDAGELKEITSTRTHSHRSSSGTLTYSHSSAPTRIISYESKFEDQVCEAVSTKWEGKASLYTHRESFSEESISVSISVDGSEVMCETAFRNVRITAEAWADEVTPAPDPVDPQRWTGVNHRERIETVITTGDGEFRDVYEPPFPINSGMPAPIHPLDEHRATGSMDDYDVRLDHYLYATGPTQAYRIAAGRNSNAVCSLYVMAPTFKATGLAATPRGAVSVPEITHTTTGAANVVGSFNPVTGEVARSRTDPVSWI